MAIGEANGNSSTFNYKITIGYTERLCGDPVAELNLVSDIKKDIPKFGTVFTRTGATYDENA